MTEAEEKGSKYPDHDELKDSIKEMSDDLEEKYDEKIKSLEKSEVEEDDFDDLENRYRDLKKEVSEARKENKDVWMAHNILLSFPSKLEVAKASEDAEDVEKAESILNEAEQELNEAVEKEEVDVREEVEERFKELQSGEETPSETRESSHPVNIEKEVGPDKQFHLYNDKDLKSIRDLMEYLPKMDNQMFRYYRVSEGKNDFAEWIENVFGEKGLADKIRNIRSKEEIRDVIKREAGE